MKEYQFFNQLFYQGINTLVSAITIIILASIVFFLLKRKTTSKKQMYKIRSRVVYIAIIIFLLALIRIWIEGFTHLFTMLSLVAAGLVVINKENIMNFTGWIIINWRGLFSEGDAIQVQTYIGEVIGIKLLYFTIRETIELGYSQPTGKLIKVPNALVITNPVMTFATDDNITLYKVPYVVNLDVDPIKIAEHAKVTITKILQEKYQFNNNFSETQKFNKNKILSSGICDYEPKVELKFFSDKEKLVCIQMSFYCFTEDAKSLEQALIQSLIQYQVK